MQVNTKKHAIVSWVTYLFTVVYVSYTHTFVSLLSAVSSSSHYTTAERTGKLCANYLSTSIHLRAGSQFHIAGCEIVRKRT